MAALVYTAVHCELIPLPYFDMVQNFLIDPTHNILMGLVSYIGEVLISNSNDMLTNKEIEILASRLSALRVPYDVGRLSKTMNARKVVCTWFESPAMEKFHCDLCPGMPMEHCAIHVL